MYITDNIIVYIETLHTICMINKEMTFQNASLILLLLNLCFRDIIHWRNLVHILYNINVAES